MGGGIWQFIKFVLDRGSIDTARKDAAKAGEDIGRAAAEGSEKFMPHTRAAFSSLAEHMKAKLGSVRESVGQLADRTQSFFEYVRDQAGDVWEKAFPFTVALLMEQAIRKAISAAKELLESLVHAAAEGQRVSIEFDTVFGKLAGKTEADVERLADLFGKSKLEMKELLLHVQGLNLGLGMSRETATATSVAMVKLAGDIAGFRGVPFERAMGAVSSAMMGITRNAHQLGIPITKANIDLQALTETGKTNAKTLTEQERALASLHLIMNKTAEMTGFAERNAGNLGIEWGRITAIFKDAVNSVGIEFIPILQSLADFVIMNKDEIKSFATDGLRLLVDGFNVAANTVRIFYDIFDAGAFGFASAVELMIGKVAELIGMIPGLSKVATFGASAMKAGWEDAAKAAERMADIAKAFDSARGPNTLPRHPAGAMPGASPEPTDPNADAKARKELENQFRTAQQGLQLDETRRASQELMAQVQAKVLDILARQNLSLVDRIKYTRMLHDSEMSTVTLYDRELQRAVAASKILETRVQGTEDLIRLSYEYENMKGNTPEEETARLTRLHQTYQAIAEANTASLRAELQHAAAYDKSSAKLFMILTQAKALQAIRAQAQTPEDITAIDTAERQLKGMLREFSVADEVAGMFDSAITGAQSFSDALSMLQDDAMFTHKVLMAIGNGTAKAMMQELAGIAKGKVLENLAWAIEDTAHGIFNPIAHPGAFAAAGAHLKAAAAWGLLAGVAGAAGGGGGGGGAASAPGRAGGATADQATTAPPITNIYIDGFDPTKQAHIALVGEGIKQGQELGIINIFPNTGTA